MMSNLAQMESKSLSHPSDDKKIDDNQKNHSNILMTDVSILNTKDGQAGKGDYEDDRHAMAIESTEVQPREENSSLESDAFQAKTEIEDSVPLNEHSSIPVTEVVMDTSGARQTNDEEVSQGKYEDGEDSNCGDSLGIELENMHLECTEVRPRAENTPLESDSFLTQSELGESISMEEHSSVPVTEVAMDTSGERQVKSSNLTLSSDQHTVHIENMYGDLIVPVRTLKKVKVRDPDSLAYDYHNVAGNCLLNAVCLDVDVITKLSEVCLKFGLSKPELMPECARYTYLYDRLKKYLEAERMTRFNFLLRLNEVTDVSHLCTK